MNISKQTIKIIGIIIAILLLLIVGSQMVVSQKQQLNQPKTVSEAEITKNSERWKVLQGEIKRAEEFIVKSKKEQVELTDRNNKLRAVFIPAKNQ